MNIVSQNNELCECHTHVRLNQLPGKIFEVLRLLCVEQRGKEEEDADLKDQRGNISKIFVFPSYIIKDIFLWVTSKYNFKSVAFNGRPLGMYFPLLQQGEWGYYIIVSTNSAAENT